MNKVDIEEFLKSKKALIISLSVIFLILVFVMMGVLNKDNEPPSTKVDLEYSYLETTIGVDNLINGIDTVDEIEADKEKLINWAKDLRDKEYEGIDSISTSKNTYVYFGAKCTEDETLGFTYGKSIETDNEIKFTITANKYKNDDSTNNEHTYANTMFSIEKTNKKISLADE